jgi:hypothetical protein
MRKEFTRTWNKLNSNTKSMIISIGAFLLVSALLALSKSLFPDYDWSPVEITVTTAFSGFLINFVKEQIKS